MIATGQFAPGAAATADEADGGQGGVPVQLVGVDRDAEVGRRVRAHVVGVGESSDAQAAASVGRMIEKLEEYVSLRPEADGSSASAESEAVSTRSGESLPSMVKRVFI